MLNHQETLKDAIIPPEPYWEVFRTLGYNGYDVAEAVDAKGWIAKGSWGKAGWDLGNWPLVIIFFRTLPESMGGNRFQVAEYVEGDITLYACATEASREEVVDAIAFSHWKHTHECFVAPYPTLAAMPDSVRGPHRAGLSARERAREQHLLHAKEGGETTC